jgi:hypothetical protein
MLALLVNAHWIMIVCVGSPFQKHSIRLCNQIEMGQGNSPFECK